MIKDLLCLCTGVQKAKVITSMVLSFADLHENVGTFLEVQICSSVLLSHISCSPVASTATFPCIFSPACRRLGVKITSVENKACSVRVLSWGPFCTGNIWSCFWTAHALNMTPSHRLKHFSTTSEGYERTVILKPCPKKPVAIWKKVKKVNLSFFQRFLVKALILFTIRAKFEPYTLAFHHCISAHFPLRARCHKQQFNKNNLNL